MYNRVFLLYKSQLSEALFDSTKIRYVSPAVYFVKVFPIATASHEFTFKDANQLMQLCTARTAWSDLDQAVRAVHSLVRFGPGCAGRAQLQ